MKAHPGDGVLRVDKPEGPTSHDVVAAVRRAFGVRRVGHTGTLDPFASGLLLLCVGRATRIAEYLTRLDKTYVAVVRLGIRTDTLDRDGTAVEERDGWRSLDPSDVERALAPLRGAILQVPPQFSAKKVAGVAMHRRARAGDRVELAPTPVTVRELAVTALDLPHVHLRVRCSSGTYVRALARDLGEALGVGGHLVELRRVRVGAFGVDGAPAPEHLHDTQRVAGGWLDPLEALAHLPRVDLDGGSARAVECGRAVAVPRAEGPPLSAGPVVAAHGGRLVAVAEVRGGSLHPRKVFGEA